MKCVSIFTNGIIGRCYALNIVSDKCVTDIHLGFRRCWVTLFGGFRVLRRLMMMARALLVIY